jgi:hypothetical protein
VECFDDHDALQAAEAILPAGGTADVWEGTRYVRRVITTSEPRRNNSNFGDLFESKPANADARRNTPSDE